MHRYNPLRYFKKYPLIGVDIAIDEIRILQLQQSSQGYRIEKLLYQPLPLLGGATEVLLADMVSQAGLSGYSAAIAIPNQMVLSKQIQLSAYLKEHEISGEIRQRLSEFFHGFTEKDLYFDYYIQHSTDDLHQIFCVAVRQAQVQKYSEVLAHAGLTLRVVDLPQYALARSGLLYVNGYPKQSHDAVVFLDLHQSNCDFVVVYNHAVVFHYSWQVELPVDGAVQLLPQIQNTWQHYTARYSEWVVRFIGVTGSFAQLNELAVQVQDLLHVSVRCINPLQNMPHTAAIDAAIVNAVAPRFLLSCGLAMRDGRL